MVFLTIIIAVSLVAATFILHFLVLKALAVEIRNEGTRLRWPLLTVVLSLFMTHLVETLLYAVAYTLIDYVGLGRLEGAMGAAGVTLADEFYFSLATYTTLGIGDIVPHGATRLIAGFEALNGLLLIAWSASFTYLMMEKLWAAELDGE